MSDVADTSTQTAAPLQDINITRTAFSFITVFLIYGLGEILVFAQLCSSWDQFLGCSTSKEVEIKLDKDIAIIIDQDISDSDKKFLQTIVDIVTGQAELAIPLIRIFEVCIMHFIINTSTPCYTDKKRYPQQNSYLKEHCRVQEIWYGNTWTKAKSGAEPHLFPGPLYN